MTNEQQQVRDWMSAFGQETPEKPTIPSLEVRKLRAKLILEEALETITALGIGAYVTDEDGEWNCVQDMKFEFSDWGDERASLTEILDGCEDLKVVTEGTLVACGLCPKQKQPDHPMNCQSPTQLSEQITQYLSVGGLFNPELMDHEKVRDLLVECRKTLSQHDPHFNEVMRSNWSKMWTNVEVANYFNLVITPEVKDIKTTNHTAIRVGIGNGLEQRDWLVKDSSGKVIKSPSYSAPKFNL